MVPGGDQLRQDRGRRFAAAEMVRRLLAQTRSRSLHAARAHTACEMTAAQARALAFAAYEAGHEIIDITTRGNIQIQGLTIERIPKVIAALERTGLTTRQTGLDNIRNVTSHPLAGLVPAELIDTREAARAVTALFVGDRELADLPRKFNISFNGRADNAPPDWTQDISLLAARLPEAQLAIAF